MNSIDELEKNYQKYLLKEKENQKSNIYSAYDFVKNYRVIDFTISAILGFSLTIILKNISDDIINPIIQEKIFGNNDYVKIVGINFNIEKIVANLIFIILVICIVYFIFNYFLRNISGKIINDYENDIINLRKFESSSLIIQNKNLEELKKINEKLSKI